MLYLVCQIPYINYDSGMVLPLWNLNDRDSSLLKITTQIDLFFEMYNSYSE